MLMNGYAASDGSARRVPWAPPVKFQTQSLLETQTHLRRFESHTHLGVAELGSFDGYKESALWLPRIVLSRTSIRSPGGYDLEFCPYAQYALTIPLKGQGWIASGSQVIEASADQGVLVAPFCATHKHWLGPSDVVSLHIPADLLLNGTGDSVLGLSALTMLTPEDTSALLDLISICVTATETPLLHSSVSQHIENALLALIMRAISATMPAEEDVTRSPAVSFYVRRAEQYMRANFRPGVTLDEIADAASVSRRSLQYGFQHYHNTTPMLFFRKIRLEYARAELQRSDLEQTISAVAWNAGYSNNSRFSTDYRAFFGETPSQTLARTAKAPHQL